MTPASSRSEEEIPLLGGDVTEGVVRVGDTVRRPLGERHRFVHRVLRHLEHAGFSGAPRFHGLDAAGREVLDFIDGEVAGRPWPGWVGEASRGVSVARLVRQLDDAMVGFDLGLGPGPGPRPAGSPEPVGPPASLVSHCDVTPENTVFRGGEAYAFIDFDLARATSRAASVANLLQWWGGWQHPDDRADAFEDVDVAQRARRLVDAYGLSAEDRDWLVPVSISNAQRAWFSMRERAERLGGGWARMWDEGVGDAIHRREAWLRESADELAAAVAQ